jgi:hypothetical protein
MLMAGALLAAGCKTVRYELRPPTTDAGRLCVTQCAGIREDCRGNEIRRARLELDGCERRAEQTLRACLGGAEGNKDKRQDCERRKPGCWSHENTSRCDDDHRTCFSQCGGSVVKIVE